MIDLERGSAVRVKLGGQYWNGTVTEDRGRLGPSRTRLFRVRLTEPESDGPEFDVPADWLEIPPAHEQVRRSAKGTVPRHKRVKARAKR